AGWRLGVPPIFGGTRFQGARRTEIPSGKIVEIRTVAAFDEIHVAEEMKVLVTVGADYRVTAIGEAGALRDLGTRVETKPKLGRLATKTKLGRLLLDLAEPKDGSQVANAADTPKGVEVRITVPRLNGVIAAGSATIEVSGLKDQSFSVRIADDAKVVVTGTGDTLTAAIGDAGELDASRFVVEDAIVTALDQSLSVVHARRLLNLVACDDACVETVGIPPRINRSTVERSRLTHRDARIMGPVVDRLPPVDTVGSDVPHELSRTNSGASKPSP
ncbi:GIN domain-containing protein, partial [Singulisphaera rosea]